MFRANNNSFATPASAILMDGQFCTLTAFIQDNLATNLEEFLKILAAKYPEWLVVLPSALWSARKAGGFRNIVSVQKLFYTLIFRYRDGLLRGGDTEAHKVFGKKYAPTESETTKNNGHAKKARTFDYNDKQVEMRSHLKIGNKDSLHETLRVHFHWDAKTQRIVIGHCGKHLPLS